MMRLPRSCVVLSLVGVLAALVQPACGADVDQVAGSLKWIPADAAAYSALLHAGAQCEAIVNSRAWAKLSALPAVQTGRQKLHNELKEGSLAFLYQIYQQPENQRLLEMLGDMVSEEVFFYSGPSLVGFLDLAGQLNAANSVGPLLLLLSGQAQPNEQGKMQAGLLLRTLANNLNLIRVPDQIIGFKLSDTKRAQEQLKRLEALLTGLEAQVPLLNGRVKNLKLAGGNFLTLTLDGSLVPWQQLPLKEFEQKKGEFDALLKKLSQLQLTLAVGIRDGYLLVSISESTSFLKTLGGGKRLSERPEMKPLAEYAGKRITSISYVSQTLAAKSQASQFDGMIKLVNASLAQADVSAEQRDKMRQGLADLAKSLNAVVARAGASLALSFWSERGSEGYAYDFGEHPTLDGSKPLTLLNHVGGSPFLAVISRALYSPESYDTFVKALPVLYRYFEELALPKLDADTKDKYEQISKVVLPSLQRLDKATGTMLLPALADGQAALVFDARLTSRHWFARLPVADKSLPMLEPAVVLGVTDANLLRKAFGEYRLIVNELTTKLHEIVPNFPDFQIPELETRKAKGGTLYFYPLPAEWGVNERITPTAGISSKVAVLTISNDHAERLLAAAPLKTDGGPLADLKKPRAMATYFNWVRVLRALAPWVEQGLRAAGVDPAENVEAGDETWSGLLKQVPTVLEVLQVFRGYSSSTYFEGSVLVTHSETVIKDL